MKKTSLSPLKLLFLFLSLIPFISAYSATVRGRIKDGRTSEGLTGTTIYIKENNQINAIAGLDGTYVLKDIGPGTYTLVSEVFSFKTQEKTITIQTATDEITMDFNMQPDSVALKQVQIFGQYNQGSDNYARTEEKESDVVMNVMSAKTIQLLPDLTIGDVLQRVSGVTTEKSVTGGGQYAVIRGMNKRYNYTTIDGVKVPSPDYKNRSVPMDIFPSEMVERLEVIKTLTPDMEGDAIGGAMNLVLKEAPDHLIFDANVATGFSQSLLNTGFNTFNTSVINSKSPNEINGPSYLAKTSDFPVAGMTVTDKHAPPDIFSGFTVGNRFFGGKFGVLASANYQNTYNLTTGLFIKPQQEPLPGPTYNTFDFDYIQNRQEYVQQTRGAGHLMLDYVFNKKNKITLYNVYTQMTQVETLMKYDTANSDKNSELDPDLRTQVTYEHIYNSTLKGTDTLAHNLALDWTAAYSRAWANTPDWTDLSLAGSVGSPVTTFSTTTTVWMNNTDQDYSGYLNLTYSLKLFGQNVQLKAGAMNRDKSRDAFYAEYDINATPNQQPFTNIGAIYNNPDAYAIVSPTGMPQNTNTYAIQEDINAYYGMIKFSLGPRIDIIGGERLENTNEAYQTQEPPADPDKDGSKQYTDYLPSVEIKFKITDKQDIRASYFASISRPEFFEIVPFQITGEYYTEIGNPAILHSTANNYDLRYEFFPSPSDEILAGVFYKQIYDPIVNSIVPGSGPSAVFEQPVNDTTPATNYGFEFQVIKYIRNFGISANYTYTHSSITVLEKVYYTNAANSPLFSTAYETQPLQGQANDIANLSLIYRAPKIGLQMEVAAVYTGKSIAAVSRWYGLEQWQMPMTRLDFSFEKRLSKKIKLSLYGKVNNILNTPLTIRIFPPANYKNIPGGAWLPDQTSNNGDISSILVEKELYGQNYLMGLRYAF